MNSKTIYAKVESLYKWLKDQKHTSNAVLPRSFSWINLGDAIGSHVPSRPGFYVVRLRKPPQDNSDIVYIGESDDLKRRIGFLRGAIRRGTAPHSGGKTLRSIFGANLSQFEIGWLVTANVYAAKLFESYLILSFYEEHHRLPVANKE